MRLVCKQGDPEKPCGETLLKLHVHGLGVFTVRCPRCKKETTFRWGVEGVERAETPAD